MSLDPAASSDRPAPPAEARFFAAQFLLLAGLLFTWLLFFPVSGDGDAALHFDNLRAGWVDFGEVLHPWGRPLFAVLFMPFIPLGMFAARAWAIGLALVTAWQASLYARDVGVARWRWMPLLTLAQPFAFLLASDTMTEIPFALALVALLRLWHRRRYAAVAVICGLTPLLRPEGFLLGLVFGLLMLTRRPTGLPWPQRWATASLALLGLAAWAVLGLICRGDLLYFVHSWPWHEMDYGSGSFFTYLAALPVIFGVPLFALWVVGLRRTWESRLWPSQLLFWLIVLTHSALWGFGWMGSAGLLRIIACICPLSAIVMAEGLEVLRTHRRVTALGSRLRTRLAAAGVLVTLAWTVGFLWLLPENRASQLIPRTAAAMREYVARRDANIPAFISSEPFAWHLAGVRAKDPRIVLTMGDRADQLESLRRMPPGSCAFWDDQRGAQWHLVNCADLEALGFRTHTETRHTVPTLYFRLESQRTRFVVKEHADPAK